MTEQIKSIVLGFSNGEKWEIPVHIIAIQRAKYLADTDYPFGASKLDKSNDWFSVFITEYHNTIHDQDLLYDWFTGNYDWKDVKQWATLLSKSDKEPDYEEMFKNSLSNIVYYWD